MKNAILSVFLFLGVSALADHPAHMKADGHAVYQEGKSVATKKIALYVPTDMKKDKLILEVDGKEVEAHASRTVKTADRTMAYVLFVGVPGLPKDTALLFRGTLLMGDNLGVYYGDFFMSKGKGPKAKWNLSEAISASDAISTCEDACDCDEACGCGDECDCTESDTCTTGCECGKGKCDNEACDCENCTGGCKGNCKPHPKPLAKKVPAPKRDWKFGGGFGFHAKVATP